MVASPFRKACHDCGELFEPDYGDYSDHGWEAAHLCLICTLHRTRGRQFAEKIRHLIEETHGGLCD